MCVRRASLFQHGNSSPFRGAGPSSEVERSLMVRWVVGSILHGVDQLSYFSFQPVLHDWCNKGRGMCYPFCGMVHIKEPLLLIDKSSLCGGSGFPFSLTEWSVDKLCWVRREIKHFSLSLSLSLALSSPFSVLTPLIPDMRLKVRCVCACMREWVSVHVCMCVCMCVCVCVC